MARVISLLPAATDMVAVLGAADALVGVTHECDFPADVVRGLPRVTGSPIEGDTAGEIDRQVREATPEVLCIAPCGYDVARAEVEAEALLARPEWRWARELPVWILNGNVLTSRPGPRIVDGVEVVAAVLHPTLFGAPSPEYARRLL
ncbi:MAG TPA: hypothetical protein VNU46_04440 [Gemmatimonadaceae bacterium]|jgi:ABC-type Fe3+-hydroxamate transport system substrate-binding protein|nr:hypothetical protein [Gemmatimonadaceae bacterium]